MILQAFGIEKSMGNAKNFAACCVKGNSSVICILKLADKNLL